MTLAVKEKLWQAVRGGLICSQTVHGRGIKFWRTNRRGIKFWRTNTPRKGVAMVEGWQGAVQTEEWWVQRSWGRRGYRASENLNEDQTGWPHWANRSGPTWDGKGKPLDGTDMIRFVLCITHDVLWRMNQRGPESKWKDQHGRRERENKIVRQYSRDKSTDSESNCPAWCPGLVTYSMTLANYPSCFLISDMDEYLSPRLSED